MMRKFLYRLLLTSFLMIRQNFEINIRIIKSYYRNTLTLAFNLTYAFYTSSTFFSEPEPDVEQEAQLSPRDCAMRHVS